MGAKYRQEVFNVLLAQLLQERGVISAPEIITKLDDKTKRRIPDVIVDFRGLRMVIEGEVSDRVHAEDQALHSARRRVEEGIAHIAVAAVYPAELRDLSFHDLKPALQKTTLRIAVVTESGESGMSSGDVDYLENALRLAYDQLLKEDIVARAVAVLDAGVERFARVMVTRTGDVGRAAEALGIRELPDRKKKSEENAE
ncbi:MAG: hypothetical protein AB1744_06960 [Candidatus Zixiibacteriota bacterium]